MIFNRMSCYAFCTLFLMTQSIAQENFQLPKKITRYTLNRMKVVEWACDLFDIQPVITDKNIDALLKKYPLTKEATYVSIPWAALIELGLNDTLPHVPKFKVKKGFTFCQHIHFQKIIPTLKRIGVDTLYTPHTASNTSYQGIRVLPFPLYPMHSQQPKKKTLLYSFIGSKTHRSRDKIFSLKHPDNTCVIKRKSWHFWPKLYETMLNQDIQNQIDEIQSKKDEYVETLVHSRFSLCPRGTGPNSIRFWESLQAGAIPVVIADSLILPSTYEWAHAIIQIPENAVDFIPEILQKIPPKTEKIMRENCLKAFEQFEDENLVKYVEQTYFEKNNIIKKTQPLTEPHVIIKNASGCNIDDYIHDILHAWPNTLMYCFDNIFFIEGNYEIITNELKNMDILFLKNSEKTIDLNFLAFKANSNTLSFWMQVKKFKQKHQCNLDEAIHSILTQNLVSTKCNVTFLPCNHLCSIDQNSPILSFHANTKIVQSKNIPCKDFDFIKKIVSLQKKVIPKILSLV